jgi:hypothetical protein
MNSLARLGELQFGALLERWTRSVNIHMTDKPLVMDDMACKAGLLFASVSRAVQASAC